MPPTHAQGPVPPASPHQSTAASSQAPGGPTLGSREGRAQGACPGVRVASPQLPQPSLLLPTAARLRHRYRCHPKAECCSRRPHRMAPREAPRAGPAQKAGDHPVGSDAVTAITAANADAQVPRYRLTFLCRQPKTHSTDDVPTVQIRERRPRERAPASGPQAEEAVLGFESGHGAEPELRCGRPLGGMAQGVGASGPERGPHTWTAEGPWGVPSPAPQLQARQEEGAEEPPTLPRGADVHTATQHPPR